MAERQLARKEQQEMVPERQRIRSPFEEMERWFEEAFRRPFFAPAWMERFRFPELRFPEPGEISPSVDIFEDGNDVVVKAEIPGISKENLDVNITEDMITISGEKKAEEKVERKDYHRIERSFGSFTRRLRLPVEIQADKARATFRDGVLEVRIPKSEAAKEKVKKITVE